MNTMTRPISGEPQATLTNARWSLTPRTYDFVAHFEPRADFALSAGVRRTLDELGGRYRRATWMTGKHSGRPVLHTDIQGISVGTRLEVSRLVWRPAVLPDVCADVFRMFVEASHTGIASGPIRRIIMHYPKSDRRPVERLAARHAFRTVFGYDCCFLITSRKQLEFGRAVSHQTLLEHFREQGPIHGEHTQRVEAVRGELQKHVGRYEQHNFFVKPIPRPGLRPELTFCYSGDAPDHLVEVAMRQKTGEELVFVSANDARRQADVFTTLAEYEQVARRIGELWVMQGDLVRSVDRGRAAVLFLFMDECLNPHIDRWFTWDELFQRQQSCQRIDRGTRRSSTFLDMSLKHLADREFITQRNHEYALHPQFEQFRHVTFYDLNNYSKRLSTR